MCVLADEDGQGRGEREGVEKGGDRSVKELVHEINTWWGGGKGDAGSISDDGGETSIVDDWMTGVVKAEWRGKSGE